MVSAIMNFGQKVDRDWPLHIQDNQGNHHQVCSLLMMAMMLLVIAMMMIAMKMMVMKMMSMMITIEMITIGIGLYPNKA